MWQPPIVPARRGTDAHQEARTTVVIRGTLDGETPRGVVQHVGGRLSYLPTTRSFEQRSDGCQLGNCSALWNSAMSKDGVLPCMHSENLN